MKLKSIIFIVIAGILWGTSGIFVEFLAPMGFTSLQMTAMRGTVSALFMGLYILIRDRRLFCARPICFLFFLGSGLGLFGTAASYFAAMQRTSIATAVVLMYMAPVLVTVFSVLFLKERFTVKKGIAIAAMLVGCALVSGIVGGLRFDLGGILLGILSAIVYAAYSIFTKMGLERGAQPMTATFYTFLVMAVFALSFSSPIEFWRLTVSDPLRTLPLIVGIGVVTCISPYFLYTLALRNLPAGTASALSIVEPMAATVFSVVLFSERLGIASGIGIALILSAVIVLSLEESDKRKKPREEAREDVQSEEKNKEETEAKTEEAAEKERV
jgi:drug/metabolite transporter (DMT)-like permease